MKQRIQERIQSLQSEYDAGQKLLSDLEARRSTLTSTLLRIEGALQALHELEAESTPNAARAPSS